MPADSFMLDKLRNSGNVVLVHGCAGSADRGSDLSRPANEVLAFLAIRLDDEDIDDWA